MDTEFVELKDFPKYVINKKGEIKSKKYNKILKSWPNRKGYLTLTLWKDKSCPQRVHRLVASTFISNPLNLPQVNHKDGDKLNNNDWNLEWTDQKGNMQHASVNFLRPHGETASCVKLTDEKVSEIRKLKKNGMKNKELSKLYNISPSHISRLARGFYWKHIKNTTENNA